MTSRVLARSVLLLVFLIAAFGLLGAAFTGTTTVSAASYTYNGPTIARVDVHHVRGFDAAETQLRAAKEACASPSLGARGTSTTYFGSFVATNSVGGFGGLSRADDFGVWSYRTLRSDLAGTGLQAHHLSEKRFAAVMGQSADDMASIAVTKAEHQVFTNAWRAEIPYGANGTGAATRAQIDAAARKIYADYPDTLKALGL